MSHHRRHQDPTPKMRRLPTSAPTAPQTRKHPFRQSPMQHKLLVLTYLQHNALSLTLRLWRESAARRTGSCEPRPASTRIHRTSWANQRREWAGHERGSRRGRTSQHPDRPEEGLARPFAAHSTSDPATTHPGPTRPCSTAAVCPRISRWCARTKPAPASECRYTSGRIARRRTAVCCAGHSA
jgi:hypothetical protein